MQDISTLVHMDNENYNKTLVSSIANEVCIIIPCGRSPLHSSGELTCSRNLLNTGIFLFVLVDFQYGELVVENNHIPTPSTGEGAHQEPYQQYADSKYGGLVAERGMQFQQYRLCHDASHGR